MNNPFLPDSYEIPSKPYTKLQIGDNTIRILDSPIIGYVYFNQDNKPVRQREAFEEIPHDIKIQNGKVTAVKHFWAMKIWNYKTNRIEILEITQKGIQEAIKSLAENMKWGHPSGYDIVINKKGEGLTTEYSVIPEPKTELADEQARALTDTYVNLDALYTNGDPFTK